MFKNININLFLSTALALTLIKLDLPSSTTSQTSWVNMGSQVEARSSGGRSSGGSFSKSSSKSSSSSNKSSSSSSKSSSKSSSSSNKSLSSSSKSSSKSSSSSNKSLSSSSGKHSSSKSNSHRTHRHTEIEIEIGDDDNYIPARGSTTNSAGVILFFNIILLSLMALIILAVVYSIFKSLASTPKAESQRDNNIVTLTKLQVALLAKATGVQSELSELILRVDPNNDEGLWELLQESVLVLLRHDQYWSHALATSESIKIDQAEQAFNKLSLTERSKLNAETLTNINGKLGHRAINISEDESSAYIIVTLLLGTAEDRPLFNNIHSVEELKQALEKLSSMPADYLMKLELIWSPQDETDSLSYDEFISEYTDMVQLV